MSHHEEKSIFPRQENCPDEKALPFFCDGRALPFLLSLASTKASALPIARRVRSEYLCFCLNSKVSSWRIAFDHASRSSHCFVTLVVPFLNGAISWRLGSAWSLAFTVVRVFIDDVNIGVDPRVEA